MEKMPEEKRTQRAQSAGELYQNVRTIAVVLSALILIFTFVVRIIVVSGPSMENTLFNGDAMVVWSLGYQPKQGDVVVLTQPSYQEDAIVKRVIATGGQHVVIDYSAGTVSVDGEVLREDYIKEWMLVPAYGYGNDDLVVPEGCLFVMGDNRNHSADSRYPTIGVIDARCVIGRAVMVVFPFSNLGLI